MAFTQVHVEIAQRLALALMFGGAIGLERSYHGRPAGFRTHALVCLSTALLMLISAYDQEWFSPSAAMRNSLDPTRVAQGIMTGIGFLGGGVIIKDGLTVRGLTTAASIWITAAMGILVGIGFYFPAMLALALTLGTLSVFRWIESKVPAQFYAQFTIRFARDAVLSEAKVRSMLLEHGFTVANLSYRLDRVDNFFEYRMVIRSDRADNARAFAESLTRLDAVTEFRLAATGD